MAHFFLKIFSIITLFNGNINKEFVCLHTKKAVKIDARLNEWEHARMIKIKDETRKTSSNAIVRTLWDEQNLYIAFQVQDSNLEAEQIILDHERLYLDDMVEFLIDSRNDKTFCWNEDDVIYHINLLGQKKDDKGSVDCVTNPGWNGNASYAIEMTGTLNDSSDIDIGYVIEVSISWEELNLEPGSGLTMGVNFAIGDNGKLFDWVNASPFRSPDAFGSLVLTNNRK